MNGDGGPSVAGTAAKSAAAKLVDLTVSVARSADNRLHVVAGARRVESPATGNVRIQLIWRCPRCRGAFHVSHARGDSLPSVVERRTVHGRVVLHVAAEATAVAV